jgi:hypothetical protein
MNDKKTTKKDHYSNILLLSIDGSPLVTISLKKAKWYLRKGLAYKSEDVEGYTQVIQLNFQPKKVSTNKTAIASKENRCVISGETNDLTLHHVIPYCIKKYFPLEEKEHTNQWCVLLKEEIHHDIEKKTKPTYDLYLTGFQHEVHLKKLHDKHEKNECQRKWMLRLIEDLGGVQKTKLFYKKLFLSFDPKFIPEGFLQDID